MILLARDMNDGLSNLHLVLYKNEKLDENPIRVDSIVFIFLSLGIGGGD